MFAAIRRYQADPGAVQEINRRVAEGFVPILRQVPGFVSYAVLDAGGGGVATISIFEDRAGAEESTRHAASWAREHLADLLQGAPDVTAGELLLHETK